MRPLLMTEDGQGRPHASIGPKVLLGRLGQSFGPWHCPDHTVEKTYWPDCQVVALG